MNHYTMLNADGECIAIVSGKGEVANLPQLPFPFIEYIGKYYYSNQWWERIWDEVDEEGNPVEGSTYTDVPWEPVDGETSTDNT